MVEACRNVGRWRDGASEEQGNGLEVSESASARVRFLLQGVKCQQHAS